MGFSAKEDVEDHVSLSPTKRLVITDLAEERVSVVPPVHPAGMVKQEEAMKLSSLSFAMLFLFGFFCAGDADLAADMAALVAFRASIGGRPFLMWNISDSSPCSWVGVACDKNGVYELRLPGVGLSGNLPLGLGNLTQLQTLSLRLNALTGPLPPDLANLFSLRNLYLQGNSFTGPIPSFLFSLRNLVRLNMADNNFSGEIPTGFNHLPRLATLYLENNELTGSISGLHIPSVVQFNVSFNRINGSIPSSLSGMPASAFEGTSLCGPPLKSCNDSTLVNKRTKNKLSGGAIALIVMGCLIILAFIIVSIFIFLRQRKTRKSGMEKAQSPAKLSSAIENTAAGGSDGRTVENRSAIRGEGKSSENQTLIFFEQMTKKFDLDDLLRASAEVLGKGTFGTTYKAALEMGKLIAVKRLKDVVISEDEFRKKIEEVGRLNHENLVPLRGYYCNRDEKFLIYDFFPMGSLSALLHGGREAGRTPLNWDARSRIAFGAARGIAYLHSHNSISSHGNVKSSNVLLTSSYEACVADFALSHLSSPSSAPTRIAGYRAPEVTDSHKASQKSDVYSFGVLLLELLTGKAPTYSLLNEDGVDLPRWVQSVVQEEWSSQIFDDELIRYQNVEDEMIQLLELALRCSAQHPDNRPSMAEASSIIEDLCFSSSQKYQEISDSSPQIPPNDN